MTIDLSKLRLHDVVYFIGLLYGVALGVLEVASNVSAQTGVALLTTQEHTIIVVSLIVVAAIFTQLHKMGFDVPNVDPPPTESTVPNPKE